MCTGLGSSTTNGGGDEFFRKVYVSKLITEKVAPVLICNDTCFSFTSRSTIQGLFFLEPKVNNEYVKQTSTGGVGVLVSDAAFSETKLVFHCGLGSCVCLTFLMQ